MVIGPNIRHLECMAFFCTAHFALIAFLPTLQQFALLLFALITFALIFWWNCTHGFLFVPNALISLNHFALILYQFFSFHYNITEQSFCTNNIFLSETIALIVFKLSSLHYWILLIYFFCTDSFKLMSQLLSFLHWLICTIGAPHYLSWVIYLHRLFCTNRVLHTLYM